VFLKFNSKFSACTVLMAIPSYGASRLRISDIVPDDATF